MDHNGTKNRSRFPELPAEIVDKIFIECLPSTKSRPSGFHPKHAPLLLTHVCSSWRTFALDCPSLWREFSLSSGLYRINFALHQERMLEQIALWHSATKGPRLKLSLALHPPEARMKEPIWQRHIQAALVDHIENIHKLRLRLRGVDEAISFFQLPSERLSNLEDLHLELIFSDTIKAVEKISKAPGLRRLQLSVDTYVVGELSMTPLPRCQQLTHLNLLEYYAPTPFHSILHSFPALEQLSATFTSSNFRPQWDVTPVIVMEHLTNLSLIFRGHYKPSIFQHMSFPALKYLRLSTSTVFKWSLFSWGAHDNIHQAHLRNQLHLLHTLVLTRQNISGSRLLEVLHSTPLLVKLVVDLDVKSYRSVFAGLTNTPVMEQILLIPKLEEFATYMDIRRAEEEDGFEDEIDGFKGAMLAMLRSRCRSRHNESPIDDGRPVRLRKVLLCFEDWPPTSDILLSQGWGSQEVEFPFDDLDFEYRTVSKQEWISILLSF